jgi:PAS domain S-box-containing protein
LDPLATISPDGKVTDVNRATEKVTGRLRTELIGTDFSDYFTDPEKARTGYQQVFREGSVEDFALEIRHRDGGVTPVLYNASVYRDDSGHVVGVFAAARDITDLKRAESELRKVAGYNRSLLEASLDPLVTITANGTIGDVNEATVHGTGISREKLIGTDFCQYFTDPARARAGYEQVFREGSVRGYELVLQHKSGKTTPVLYNASVYCNAEGEVAGVFAGARDVTDISGRDPRRSQRSQAEFVTLLQTPGCRFGVRAELRTRATRRKETSLKRFIMTTEQGPPSSKFFGRGPGGAYDNSPEGAAPGK